jgi:hypothetical protein
MPTIKRARHVQSVMSGTIYFDTIYNCYRVLSYESVITYNRRKGGLYPSIWIDHLQRIE